jgi:hypothetical protein
MARQKIADEIDAIRRQRQRLDARLKAAEARRKEKEQRENQRRITVVGTAVIKFMTANPDSETARTLAGILDQQLTRPAERTLLATLIPSAHTANQLAATRAKSDPASE